MHKAPARFSIPTNLQQRQSDTPDNAPVTTTKFGQLFARIDHVHGVTEWYSSTTYTSKALWTVVLLGALVLLTVEVSMCVFGFLNSPIVTSYKLINEPDGMKLPEIFICPSNPVDNRKVKRHRFDTGWVEKHAEGLFKSQGTLSGLSGLLAANAKLSATVTGSKGGMSAVPDCTVDPLEPCKEPPALRIPNNIQDYFMKVGYDGDNFLKECSFGAKPVECGRIATAYFDGDYGTCFHIHVDEKQVVDGVGLSIVVDLAMNESYMPFDKPLFDGVILKVNSFNHSLTNNILQLSAGSINTVTLNAREMEVVPYLNTAFFKDPAKSFCVENTTPSALEKLDIEYSQLSCIQDCHQQTALDECKCFLAIDRKYVKSRYLNESNIDVCTKNDFKNCLLEANDRLKKELSNCAYKCKTPCKHWTYQPQVTSVNFPSGNSQLKKEKEAKEDCTKKGYLCFKIKNPILGDDVNDRAKRSLPSAPLNEESNRDTVTEKQDYASICHHPIARSYTNIPDVGQPAIPASVHKRWAYDMEKKDCVEFEYYGWIGGVNGFPIGIKTDTWKNSFPNKNGCLNNCAYGNRCVVDKRTGDSCHSKNVMTTRYYYNLEHHKCLRFYLMGCDGNANNFQTREDCQLACGAELERNKCLVYQTDVLVVLKETRWVFNRKYEKCEKIYVRLMDCQTETSNRFANRKECELACHENIDVDKYPLIISDTDKRYTSGTNESCMENKMPSWILGCNKTTRYYYEASLDVCSEIEVAALFRPDYFFDTKDECEKYCNVNVTYVKPKDWNGLNPDALPPFRNLSAFTNDTEKMQSGDFIIINIAHGSLLHVQMVQTYSMTFSTFVSNIGGQMGLWLGCSIISVLKVGSIIGPVVYLLTKQLLTKFIKCVAKP